MLDLLRMRNRLRGKYALYTKKRKVFVTNIYVSMALDVSSVEIGME